jgi:hypothetical protein
MKLENDMVVHCDTKEKAKKLIKMLGERENLKWINHWGIYGDKSCYELKINENSNFFYRRGGYDIVEFDDLDLSSYENENQNSESNTDLVNHPKHYQLKNGLEVIDVVEAFTDGLEGIDAVDIGNAVKYLGRLGKKDNNIQEVNKAIWYLKHYVDRSELPRS